VSEDRVFARKDPSAAQEIGSHSQDMSFHMTHPPDMVVYPLSAEEVAAIVALCNLHVVPVIARGAGSGLEGSSIPYFGGVVLDLMRMKKIELLASDSQCRVQPGLKKSELNEWLELHGLLFGPDPASNPSIGGMASTSGSGLSTIMYGTTRENIVSLKVVTAEGKIVKTRSRVRKSSAGYDLTNLVIGSEGTLGIIVELTLRLYVIPKTRTGALVSFTDIFDASNAVIAIVRSGAKNICRCELLNADGILATNEKYGTTLTPAPTLFLEFRGEEVLCTTSWELVSSVCMEHKSTHQHYTTRGEELDKLWEARRGCYLASISYRKKAGDRVYLSDTCVPISNLAEMVSQTEKDFMAHGFPCIICAHIADGNFHCCIPYQLSEQAKVIEVEHRMISRAISMEGTVSGEHGVGIGKIVHIEEEHGGDHINLQRAIKRAWDPKNIMNPGKLFILPTLPGGPCELPAIYTQTKDGATKGTYTH
jgi:D-lactate dehydrogenase (cytochrome)